MVIWSRKIGSTTWFSPSENLWGFQSSSPEKKLGIFGWPKWPKYVDFTAKYRRRMGAKIDTWKFLRETNGGQQKRKLKMKILKNLEDFDFRLFSVLVWKYCFVVYWMGWWCLSSYKCLPCKRRGTLAWKRPDIHLPTGVCLKNWGKKTIDHGLCFKLPHSLKRLFRLVSHIVRRNEPGLYGWLSDKGCLPENPLVNQNCPDTPKS